MNRTQPVIAVSTVIFALRAHPETGASTVWIPVVRRIREPFEGRWALPGGPLEGGEDLVTAAGRTLRETTNLEPRYLEQLYAFGSVDRTGEHTGDSPQASAERVVSIVYWALVQSDEAERATVDENVTWLSTDELAADAEASGQPSLAFDHDLIVDYALWRLRTKMEYSRIAHAFLGDTFTLAELREVHEAVRQKPLDPANFRRMIESSKSVVPTEERVTGTRHRPPRLYRYVGSVDLADQGPVSGL